MIESIERPGGASGDPGSYQDTLAGLSFADNNIVVGNGSAWVVESGATARESLGLTIGTNVQAYDADLAAIAALANTDGNIIVGNGSTWVAESGATARTSLGLAIGTDVQAYNAKLADIAALTPTDRNIMVGNGTTWVSESQSVGLSFSVAGTPGDAAIYHVLIPFAITIPANFSGSYSYASVTATASAVFNLAKNGAAAFGTLTFAIGANTATLSSSLTSFAAGDRLTITCPTPQDATLADVGFTIKATRS